MRNSIGLVEFKSISKGIETADGMMKSAGIELLQATPFCPGKYVVLIGGELSAVNSAVDYAKQVVADNIIDSFVIGNVSQQVFPALTATTEIRNKNALGIIETFTVASAIEGADLAVKAAVVDLIEIRLARGMGGKCIALMTGGVADVTAAVEAGAKKVEEQGLLVNKIVIANPHKDLWEKII
ncbi:MAG: hypothetical protein PWR27_939 [Petroclostridium sp.]|jgi:microcompartment protein CcmL/EutN|uniref:BMC domain-containing protein n=1 Tax=Petroclostridium xylanilyticum TaxID=1792311 RepID=UPI000B98AC59|nr:BMC domain-containing protein [Petroclostridium xylanilyticum]MBZ4644537.1 microcompartment protein [Clostridia bacterium]MDK2810230.1 hypothetical protein [Petroclostridium sp.]